MKIKKIFNKMGGWSIHAVSETLNILPPALLFISGLTNQDTDNRRTVPDTEESSNAIGRLTMPKAQCTATLIAPNIVLTAAHCVIDVPQIFYSLVSFSTNNVDENGNSTFFSSSASDIWIHPQYPTYKSIRFDIALVKLRDNAPSVFNIFELADVQGNDPITVDVYGYSKDFPGKSVEENCQATPRFFQGYLVSDCNIHMGGSGGPVIDAQNDNIIGVNSAISYVKGTNIYEMSYHAILYSGVFDTVPFSMLHPDDNFNVYTVTASSLNIREYPDTHGFVIDTIPTGTCVIVDENHQNGWKQIRLDPSKPTTNMFLSDGSAYGSQYIQPIGQMTRQEMSQNCPPPRP